MTENRDVWKRSVRAMLIGAAVFLFSLVAGCLAGWALGLTANFIAGGMQQAHWPLAYKALQYCCYLYAPFLALTLVTASRRWIPGRGLPASLAYLTVVGIMFAKRMYFARGMEIESRPVYALVLFVPSVIVIALGLLVSRRSKQVIIREQQV